MKERFQTSAENKTYPCPIPVQHGFENLIAFLNAPENIARPLLIGDEDHENIAARTFLLSPFLNVQLLARNGFATIYHEMDTKLQAAFNDLKTCPPEERLISGMDLLEHLDKAGYRNQNHIMEKAYAAFPDSVLDASLMGADIRPWDLRSRKVDPAIFVTSEREYEKRLKAVDEKMVRARHQQIFGHNFEHGPHVFGQVVEAILKDDISNVRHRQEERAIADLMVKDANGKRWAAVMGSAHLQGVLIEQLRSHGQDPVRLDLSVWHNHTNMIAKIYNGQDASPTYCAVYDTITKPDELKIDATKAGRFKEALLEDVGAMPVVAAGPRVQGPVQKL